MWSNVTISPDLVEISRDVEAVKPVHLWVDGVSLCGATVNTHPECGGVRRLWSADINYCPSCFRPFCPDCLFVAGGQLV